MNEKSCVTERLELFLREKKTSNRKFEINCGFSNGWVGNIREQIRIDALNTIIEQYPNLNIDWLITGRGSMFYNDNNERSMNNSLSPAVNIESIHTVNIGNWDALADKLKDIIMNNK